MTEAQGVLLVAKMDDLVTSVDAYRSAADWNSICLGVLVVLVTAALGMVLAAGRR